jgi:hypothetical protein
MLDSPMPSLASSKEFPAARRGDTKLSTVASAAHRDGRERTPDGLGEN